MVRKALETASDFNSAVTFLNQVPLDAPVYLTMSGTEVNVGTIIEKNPTGGNKQYDLNLPDVWSLIVTNYELDKPDPFYDFRR